MKSKLVDIPEEMLRKSVEYALSKKSGEDISIDDMASLKVLYLDGPQPVKDFEGLQYAVNLITLSCGTFASFSGSDISQLPDSIVNLMLKFLSDVDISRINEMQYLTYVKIIDVTGFSDFSKISNISPQLMYFECSSGIKFNSKNKSLDFIKNLDNLVNLKLENVNVITEEGEKLYLALAEVKTENYLTVTFTGTNIVDISDFESWSNIKFVIDSHLEVIDNALGAKDSYQFKNIFISSDGPIYPYGIVPQGMYDEKNNEVNFSGTKDRDLIAYSVYLNREHFKFDGDVFIMSE